MRHSVTAIAAAAFGLVASSGAVAQVATISAPATKSLGADFEAVYDTNVAGVSAAAAARERLKPADETVSPAVSGDFVVPLGPDTFFVRGSAGYNFYARNPILNSQVIALGAGLDARYGHCTGEMRAGYGSQQSSLSELTIGVVRNIADTESVALSATCPRTTGFAPSVAFSDTAFQNSNPVEHSSDNNTFTASVGAVYTRPKFGDLSLYFEYDDTEFSNRLVRVGGGFDHDGYHTYSEGIRYDRRLGARIEGVAFLSYTEVDPTIAREGKVSGLTYAADVTFRATGKITAHLRIDREVLPVLLENTTYSLQEDYIADASYAITPHVSATIGVSSQNQDFKGATLNSAVDLTRQRTNSIYGSASLSLGRRLAFVLDLRQEDRAGSLSTYDYSSTRVSLTAKATF